MKKNINLKTNGSVYFRRKSGIFEWGVTLVAYTFDSTGGLTDYTPDVVAGPLLPSSSQHQMLVALCSITQSLLKTEVWRQGLLLIWPMLGGKSIGRSVLF